MNLFLDKDGIQFEKVALEARLPDDVNEWPQAILDQLYKQAPYTSHYSPKVVLSEVDPDKRYALGHIELVNKLAINPRDDDTPPELKGKQRVVLPVIVREGRLFPIDLLLDNGAVYPLTDDRLRKALFSPSLFEAIRQRPGDLSMIEQLYPPNRQFGGARGPLITEAGSGEEGVKVSHPRFLLDAILPTIKKAHVEEFSRLLEDPVVASAVTKNEVLASMIDKIASINWSDRDGSFLKSAMDTVRPTVIQIQKMDGGFRVKTANPIALMPAVEEMTRPEAINALGQDTVSRVEQDGTLTVSTVPVVKETLDDLHVSVVDRFGIYKVRSDIDNKELIGWVFPHVVDLNGMVLPLAVFGNGSESAVQDKIAGVPIARQTDIINAEPNGFGTFYYASRSGATALVPVEVRAVSVMSQTPEYLCETVLGESCTLVKQPGLKTVAMVAPGRYAIPEDSGFMPLPNLIDLAESPDAFTKVSEAREYSSKVRVITDGLTYSFEGAPVDKIASVVQTRFIDLDDAVFLGAILGQDPDMFKEACLSVRQDGSQEFSFIAGDVDTMKRKVASAKKEASKLLSRMPDLRAVLLKEAAMITDPLSVDKILSLGFLNPENLATFSSYSDEIEGVISKLSELLLASRLGLSAVPTVPLERSIAHLDKVVSSLRAMSSSSQA